MAERIERIEERVDDTEEREIILVEVIKALTQDQKESQMRLEYLENKSRQNNIRIYNVKENNDSVSMIDFVEMLLLPSLGKMAAE